MEAEELPDDVSASDLLLHPRSALELPPEKATDLLPAVETLRGQLDTLSRLLRARRDSRLPEDTDAAAETSAASDDAEEAQSTWREKLWQVPAETRLYPDDLAEAVGRDRQWIYRRTQSGADNPIPHRKHGNRLVFIAGEIRHWLREQEEAIHAGPMDSTEAEKRGLRAIE